MSPCEPACDTLKSSAFGIGQMRAMVCVEREPNCVRRDAEMPRELLPQRHTHGGETKRVFVAEKFAGSRAFVVAECGEGSILQGQQYDG